MPSDMHDVIFASCVDGTTEEGYMLDSRKEEKEMQLHPCECDFKAPS